MTTEQAINEIVSSGYGQVQCHEETMRMAVDALRAQQERENQKPQWISVKNRLPDKNQYVLGYFTEMDGTSMAMRIIPGQNVNERGAIGGYGATHWMPLPEPPKEAQK